MLLEEQVRDCYCGNGAREVGQQTAGGGMAGVAYAHAAKVDGKDVEGSIGRALQDARQASYKRVGTIVGHRVDHHATSART